MKLLSAPVLGAAALVTAPALWSALVTGGMPAETAAVRFAVVVVLGWAALSLVAMVVGPPPAPPTPQPAAPASDGDTVAFPAVDASGEPAGSR
ncbi:hypothetical protein [Nocardioides sp. SYSU DS0663]|uniref:hypothetical protein n=1 Tax=Nocardioides sp. SYSU DS0663 TaxID=3416445 RepID=UPI003F4BD06A